MIGYNDMFFFDNFDFLDADLKTWMRKHDVFIDLLLFISSMFDYEGFDGGINTDFIEFYNALSIPAGCGAFKDNNGKEVLGYIASGGLPDAYGIPIKFNINTLNGKAKQGAVPGENMALCWNNKTHTPDIIKLRRYTELISMVDTAQKCLMKYARLFPVFEVDNDQVKGQIDNALKNADNGEPVTYVTKGLSKIGADGIPNLKILRLGDINAVDKIQYLSTYRNDLMRHFYSMYGMSYSQSMKQAQQSIEEIHSDTILSWVIPNDRLQQRQKFVDQYNQVFGHNATVKYSDAWAKGYEKYMEEVESDEI